MALRVKRSTRRKWLQSVQDYVVEFLEQTSIHGLRHLMATTRHPLELLLWMVVILASVFCCVVLCRSSWDRYQENPTVVSMERDYRSWEVSFPASTICYLERLNRSTAAKFIFDKWGEVDTPKADYYLRFLNEVTNISYNNLQNFEQFANDKTLANLSLTELVLEFQTWPTHIMEMKLLRLDEVVVFTEHGLCYTGQSSVAHHFPVVPSVPSVHHPRFIPHTMCDPVTFCSSTYNNLRPFIVEPKSFVVMPSSKDIANVPQFAVHSPFEMIDIHTMMIISPQRGWLTDTNFKYLSMVPSAELRKLRPAQRRCNFADEPEEIGLPLYSYNLCQTVCRKREIEKRCGCIPLFYSPMGGGKVCTLQGLTCAGKIAEGVIDTSCNCRPLCEDIYFTKDKDEIMPIDPSAVVGFNTNTNYQLPITASWRISYVTKFRLMRNVVFSFVDLLVSFGGTAGLFLGCSLLSGVEIVYFFTLRLVFHVLKKTRGRH